MLNVYLSPSMQGHHQYATGTGSEEYYMNLIADAMIPCLQTYGIICSRNNPGMTLPQVIARSNEEVRHFHLALHSNTAPENLAGAIQGPDVYYYSESPAARRAADIFSNHLKSIYPNPNLVAAIPNNTLAELRKTKAPAVLVELAYHDNIQDARWITENIKPVARNLSAALTEFLMISPAANIRCFPDMAAGFRPALR